MVRNHIVQKIRDLTLWGNRTCVRALKWLISEHASTNSTKLCVAEDQGYCLLLLHHCPDLSYR